MWKIEMRPETEPWWRQAQADLETARRNLPLAYPYAVSWFAQQAAEKGLKALYLERLGRLAPYTHDLERLGVDLNVPAPLATDLALLNPTFEMVRYPDVTSGLAPVDVITVAEARGHLAAAERVITWIGAAL